MQSDLILSILTALGGMALFLLGMELMTDALQRLAGFQVRSWIGRLARNQPSGLAVGTGAGALIHSGPATVIVLGFVNAGILSLYQSIGLVFGANIGTTLSMQIVAFDIGKYSYALLAIAVLIRLISTSWRIHNSTMVLAGFSLLFLGLEAMKTSMAGLQSSHVVLDLLALIDSHSWHGIIIGVLLGTVLTALLQSSGATISILFSLAALGILTDFRDTIPVILGAHIGTTTPTLIAASRGTRSAWRVASVHLFFNVAGCVIALAMLRLYDWIIPLTSGSTLRQIANFNTGVQMTNALLMLPFAHAIERLVCKLIPVRENEATKSFLDPNLVRTPEMAILSTIHELRRLGRIIEQMYIRTLDGLVSLDIKKFDIVEVQEESVDLIKDEIEHYINQVGERSLSPRQGMLLQHLIISAQAFERVGDYIEALCTVTRHKIEKRIWFDDESMEALLILSRRVKNMIRLTLGSLDPTTLEYRNFANEVLAERKAYKTAVKKIRQTINARMLADGHEATTGLFYARYLSVFDKIVDHLREIARQERKETYLVKEYKLAREEPVAPNAPSRPRPHDLPETYEQALAQIILAEQEEDD